MSGDLISRQSVLDGIEELKRSPWATDKRGNGFEYLITEALDVVADLCVKQASSVNPQEPIAQERYEDLCEYFGGAKDILKNRDDFKAWLGRVKWHIRKAEELYEKYEQEPKTGHWILDETDNSITCDKCGCLIWANDICNGEAYYCPNCGARMAESEE